MGAQAVKKLMTPAGEVESVRLRGAASPADSHLPRKAALIKYDKPPYVWLL